MYFKRYISKVFFFCLLSALFSSRVAVASASEPEHSTEAGHGHAEAGHEEKAFNLKETIFHHLLDNYDWEFYQKADGTPVKLSLPRILIANGIHIYGSTEKAVAKGGFVDAHHLLHGTPIEVRHGSLLKPGSEEALKGLISELDQAPKNSQEYGKSLKALEDAVANAGVMDFSITRNVLYIFFACFLLLLVFTSVARAYKKNEGSAPKGLQSLLEPVIQFVRNDIATENIGGARAERFMPFLLTMFFFIFFLNLLGMTPFSANVTGNIAVTLALSIITLIVVNFSGRKYYWKHILWPPVPHGVKIIMVPLEILSIFTKPFALTIRLFANISGGHIIMVSLFSLIFIFGKLGAQAATGYAISAVTVPFVVAISLLELFVALLQAYVFTLLTAVFIGQAVEEHAEDHH